jgi:predicted RNA-binding protein YlxR (DUF448 family)
LSIITNETQLDIYKWLEVKYNTILLINSNINNVHDLNNLQLIDLISQYTCLIEQKEQRIKFEKNTINNLKESLFNELENNIQRIGKYFKKWSILTLDEQNDRLFEFCNSTKRPLLYNTLINHDRTELNRLIKWNIKTGLINIIDNITQDEDGNYGNYVIKNKTSIRKTSKKTIFNKDNEKIINEELLYIICVNLDNEVELDNDSIILKIKEKLKIKKMSNDDKVAIINRYTEMYNIVKDN